jgi:hypothetical protein
VSPNEVWCSKALAEQLEREGTANIKAVAIGSKRLAKHGGDAELYRLLWVAEAGLSGGTGPRGQQNRPTAAVPAKFRTKPTDAELDDYAISAFAEIARHFATLTGDFERDSGGSVSGRFHAITAHKFSTAIYVDGSQKEKCRVWLAGGDREIRFSHGRGHDDDNSYNEVLYIKADENGVYIEAMGMGFRASPQRRMTPADASAYLWRLLSE